MSILINGKFRHSKKIKKIHYNIIGQIKIVYNIYLTRIYYEISIYQLTIRSLKLIYSFVSKKKNTIYFQSKIIMVFSILSQYEYYHV